MPHALVVVWLHIIFSTKLRRPLIRAEFEARLHAHIREHLETGLGVRVKRINGMSDHIHLLVRIHSGLAIKDLVQNIKGESSHWVNQNDLSPVPFSWQKGYAVFSVYPQDIDIVEAYIAGQKEHHRERSYVEECRKICASIGERFDDETDESVS